MRAYISVDTQNKKKLNKEFIALNMALNNADVEAFIFIENFTLEEANQADYMQLAFEHIDKSNFVIVEASSLSVQTSIEIGYARAKRKPILLIQDVDKNPLSLAGGISNFQIFYESPKNLFDQLTEFLKNILPQK